MFFTKAHRNFNRPESLLHLERRPGAEARNLPMYAGMASAYGLSKADALKAVTLYPAQIMNVADRLGSIEVGKMANLVVTDGDLLEIRTHIHYLFIDGRKVQLTSTY
jgi:imidazolonepropionase-like amidohydrolase